jgi:hypothetical protein
MIRLENGNSVVLQAENEAQALEYAGIRSDPDAVARELSQNSGIEEDPAVVHLSMVRSGVGPQNYSIRKLNHFMCDFRLDDSGEFEGQLSGNDETSDEFYVDYPELNTALNLWSGPILAKETASFADPEFMAEVEAHGQHHDAAIADAVAKERTRLIAKF